LISTFPNYFLKVYLNALSEKDFVKYIEKSKNICPAILSPTGDIHIIDGHHYSRSILEADFPDDIKDIYVEIVEDFSDANSVAGILFSFSNKFIQKKNFGIK